MVEGLALICSRKPKEAEKLRQSRSDLKRQDFAWCWPEASAPGWHTDSGRPCCKTPALGNNDPPGGQGEPLRPQWHGDQLQGPENRQLSGEKSYNGSPHTFTPPRERIIPKHLRGSLRQAGWLETKKKKKIMPDYRKTERKLYFCDFWVMDWDI